MIQEIIVYIILLIAFGRTFYKLFGFFELFKNNSTKSACGSCTSSSCGSCNMKFAPKANNIIHPLKVDHKNLHL